MKEEEDSLVKRERARVVARIVITLIAIIGFPSYFNQKSSFLGIFQNRWFQESDIFGPPVLPGGRALAGSQGSRGAQELDRAQQMLRDANFAEAL